LCADAEALSEATSVPGNNLASTVDLPQASCVSAGDEEENSVWYSFDNTLGDIWELNIEVTPNAGGIPISGNVVLSAWDACGGEELECEISDVGAGTATLTITCPPAGLIFIQVGSTDIGEGEFDIVANETLKDAACTPNDLCADAVLIDTENNACVAVEATDCNTMTCPEEDNFGTGCTFTDEETVWFTFTTPDGATSVEIEVDNITSGGTAQWGLMTGDCTAPTNVEACTQNEYTVAANTQYWLAVSTTGDDGSDFELEVLVNTPPDNDECDDVETLTMDAGTVPGTTFCANPDFEVTDCGATDQEQQVWYTFTTGADQSKVELTLTETGASGVVVSILDACDGVPVVESPTLCPAAGSNEFCVLPNTTYYLLVGTSEANQGDFEIGVAEVTDPFNDNCSGADALGDIASSCEQNDFAADNSNACPDELNDDGCDFSNDALHGVWFTFNTDNDAEAIDITTDLADAMFALYTGDCTSLTYVDGSCTQGADLDELDINPNTTYYLLVTSDTESAFNIGITIKNIPDNDLCEDAESIGNGDVLSGTTACANPEIIYCDLDGSSSHDVYYTYTNSSGSNVDLEIQIDADDSNGNAADQVEVAFTIDDCITAFPGTMEECDALGNLLVVDCVEDGETVIIIVGSVDGEEGDFTISLTEFNNSPPHDECTDAYVFTDEYTVCEWYELTGFTNQDACPEDFFVGACEFHLHPVVWFAFTATDDATSVEFQNITSAGDAFLALFENNGDCDLPTAVSACVTGNDGPFDINGGQDYWVAFGSENGEGDFSFEILINESPLNDDPCAGDFALETINEGDNDADNSCAGPDFTFCGLDNANGKTLFFEYTMTQDADLEVNITGITAAGPFSTAAYEAAIACGDESTYITEACDDALILPCLTAGDVIVIAVGTSDVAGEYGEFTINISENTPPRPDNDECTDAEVITYEDSDLCQWVGAEANESNINACSEESDFGTACDFDTEEVVWFEFTAPNATDPANAQLNIQFLSYDGGGDLFSAVFEPGDCDNLTALSGCLIGNGPHGAVIDVTPNTTYLIGVGSSGDTGGNFEIEINITSGPPNDDPCADLSAFDLTGSVTLIEQSNLCAGPDGNFPECGGVDQENAVIYTFEIVAPIYGIEITVTANDVNGTPIEGTIVAGVSTENSDFCTGTTYVPPAYCEDIGSATFTFECLLEGTYQLKISSSDDNSGNFDISSTMIDKNSGCDNTLNYDYCSEADGNAISGLSECEPTTVSGCNKLACPENFTLGACDFTEGNYVWYSFTTLDGAASVDITAFSADDGNGIMTIFEADCDNLVSISDCIQEGTDVLNIPVTENTTYYIVVGGSDNSAGFDFDITVNVPPENDDPCPTDLNPAIDLTGGGSHAGTTCCAVGFNDDNNADWQNQDCGDATTDENAVWYYFTSSDAVDGYEIEVSGALAGFTTVELYTGADDAGCTGALTFEESSCTPLPANIRFGNCGEDGTTYWIKVGTSDENCGDFSISVLELDDCKVADDCEDAQDFSVNPVTDPNFEEIIYDCTEGCLDLACPENPLPAGGNGCDFY